MKTSNRRANLGKIRTIIKMKNHDILKKNGKKNVFLQKMCYVGHTKVILFDINEKFE